MHTSTRSLPNLTSYAGGLGMIKSTPQTRRSFVLTTAPQDALGNDAAVIDAWNNELHHRIHVYHKNSVEEFLDIFVPLSTPYTPSGDLDGVFSEYEPRKGGEVAGYPKLIGGLNALIEPFSEPYKLTFADTHSAQWRFPFHAFAKHHSKSSPDVSVSFPGEQLPNKPTWSDVSMCIEVKPTEGDDPFPSWKAGSTHNDTISQVARNARNLLLTHGLLQTFVVGIYANTVRIARFDHTSAVVSQAFNLQERPDLLQRFFWHFTHPTVGGTVVGCDPTVQPLSLYDQVWIRRELFGAGVANVPEELSEISKGRRVKVYNERTKKDDWYLLIRLLDVNARLLSRATTVWLAMQDTREYDGDTPIHPPSQPSTVFGVEDANVGEDEATLNGEDDVGDDKETNPGEDEDAKKHSKAPPKVRVLKEAWRQLVRTPESAFYERLDACIPDSVRWGLPKWVCGTDLGVREVRMWEDECPPDTSSHFLSPSRPLRLASSGKPPDDPPASTPSTPTSSGHSTPTPSRPSTPTPMRPAATQVPALGSTSFATVLVAMSEPTVSLAKSAPFPQHQTFTWALSRGTDYTYRERSHMRFVVDEVGRPLTEFKDTKELVRAIRDAMMGHRQAWERAGVLHRDVSVGNILIVDEPGPDGFVGFIHDFDYSAMTAAPPPPPGTPLDDASTQDVELEGEKERTGTFYFMPIDLLTRTNIVHEVFHDLESFYWVILWVVLRHTLHSLGQKQCREVFVYEPGAAKKINWLGRVKTDHEANMTLTIEGNKPLTTLMAKLRKMVRDQYNDVSVLTYEKMLEAFNDALAEDGWPADDWVECTLSEEAVDSVVSPFQFAPDHHADHLVTAPVRSADEVAMAAYRDAFAKGKERAAVNLEEVMEIKKRKNRDLGRALDALNPPSGATSSQRKRRKMASRPPKGTL